MNYCADCDIAFEGGLTINGIVCPLCEAQDTNAEFEKRILELEEELRGK